jgi:hypothetical protein
MRNVVKTFVVVVALVSVPRVAHAQSEEGAVAAPAEPMPPPTAQDTSPAPSAAPAWNAPSAQAPAQDSQSAPTGQWVHTDQYGWIWMPYGSSYSYAPADGSGEPYMYVYYPVVGWSWVVAPWLWGWGPLPYFGVYGGLRFAWYGHGWGLGWRGFRPVAFRNGVPFRGVRSAPFRASVGRPGVFASRGGFHAMAGHGLGHR